MIFFLDTNVFIAAKYRFASKYFGSLRSLISNGDIQVIYTSATRGEVEHHIREDIKVEVEQYNRMLRKDLPLLTSFSKDTLSEVSVEDLSQAIIAGLNDFLSLAGVCQIPLNPLDAEQLMADYFQGKPPFESKKPYEFKDAIMINAVKTYQKSINEYIVIVSNDDGFRKAFDGDENFTAVQYLSNALKLYSEQKEDSDIEAFLAEAVENDDFSECIQSYLGEFDISRDYYSEWECDDHQIEVDEAELLYVERADGKYLVHLALSLSIVADITHRDEDTSYFDREEQQYLVENFVKWREKHQLEMDVVVACSVEKEADGEYSPDEIAIIDDAMFKTIDLDEDTLVDWDELQTEHREEPDLVYCSECGRVIGRTVEYTDYDDNPICAECMVSNSAGDICPACGRKVPHEFMINGFCIECSDEND